MNCHNLSGSLIGIPGVISGNSISIYIKADGPPVLQPVVCTVTVTVRSSPMSKGSLASNFTKVYVYDWTSPKLSVCKYVDLPIFIEHVSKSRFQSVTRAWRSLHNKNDEIG